MNRMTWAIFSFQILAGIVHSAGGSENGTVQIFNSTPLFFSTDSIRSAENSITHTDNGRVAARTISAPFFDEQPTIIAHLVINPIPKDDLDVCDKWDRAGNIRLVVEGMPDIELVKFITAYGGRTEYEVDVSHLAPLLNGNCTFKAFVDTWVNPAWIIDFSLSFALDSTRPAPKWASGVFYDESFDRLQADSGGLSATILIPEGLSRVKLFYCVSGHCTDGSGADEFEPKDNVISVDGTVVYRYQPWRDDCRQFRSINPYTRRWSDGTWSSDYSRTGWCPGDVVLPLELDLTDHLSPGNHTLRATIENVRPKDAEGHYGYWRVSAYAVGW